MSDQAPRVSDSLPLDEPSLDQGAETDDMESLKTAEPRQLPVANDHTPRPWRRGRVVVGGYVINPAGQVIVDPSGVFGNAKRLKEALQVAIRAQEIGRRVSGKG